MRVVPKLLASCAFAAGIALSSAPALAVTIVPLSTSPFFLPGNPSGVVPPDTFVHGTGSWDFTFTTIKATYVTLMQMQASKVGNGLPEDISFNLFSGTPGHGAFVASSGGTPTAATLLDTLAAGSYFMQVTELHAPKELVTGGLTLLGVVPEPATWAMMLIGLGALGATMRRRRSRAASLA